MANTINTSVTPAAFRAETAPQATPKDKELSKDLFLKLMVAQLRNQNPLSPVDGADFLAQLSQISGVEQMVEVRKQLEGIHEILASAAGASAATK